MEREGVGVRVRLFVSVGESVTAAVGLPVALCVTDDSWVGDNDGVGDTDVVTERLLPSSLYDKDTLDVCVIESERDAPSGEGDGVWVLLPSLEGDSVSVTDDDGDKLLVFVFVTSTLSDLVPKDNVLTCVSVSVMLIVTDWVGVGVLGWVGVCVILSVIVLVMLLVTVGDTEMDTLGEVALVGDSLPEMVASPVSESVLLSPTAAALPTMHHSSITSMNWHPPMQATR